MSKNTSILNALGIPPLPSQSADTIAALLWAREVLQKHLTATYAVQDPSGIEELKPVKIGGVDQWLHIRGRNRNNPVLLFIHGGPGFRMIGTMDAIQRPWEDYFTVVHWDQRQSGKSYNPSDSSDAPFTVDQFVNDATEVIQYLRQHLGQEKIFVLGHSWGSILGMHVAKRHPEWLHAYIGVGQIVNITDNLRIIHERLLGHAREQNETEVVDKLESIAPMLFQDPPELLKYFEENIGFLCRELSRLGSEITMRHLFLDDFASAWGFERSVSPHLTFTDLQNDIIHGNSLSTGFWEAARRLMKDQMTVDLPKDIGCSFEVPIFFFSGRHDYQTPTTLSEQWFSKIEAPHKAVVYFENSCHMIFNEEPGKMLTTLVNQVLPFAQSKAPQKLKAGVKQAEVTS